MPAANNSAGLINAVAMTMQTRTNATASTGDFAAIVPIAIEAATANVRSKECVETMLLSLIRVA